MPRCSKQCVPRCECPSNSPIWYGDYTCIAKEQCPASAKPTEPYVAPTEPYVAPTAPIRPDGRVPVPEPEVIPTCSGGQVYNPCGSSCVKTCEPAMPCYSRMCIPKCECPENSPIWYGEYTCIQESQCPAESVEPVEPVAPVEETKTESKKS